LDTYSLNYKKAFAEWLNCGQTHFDWE